MFTIFNRIYSSTSWWWSWWNSCSTYWSRCWNSTSSCCCMTCCSRLVSVLSIVLTSWSAETIFATPSWSRSASCCCCIWTVLSVRGDELVPSVYSTSPLSLLVLPVSDKTSFHKLSGNNGLFWILMLRWSSPIVLLCWFWNSWVFWNKIISSDGICCVVSAFNIFCSTWIAIGFVWYPSSLPS